MGQIHELIPQVIKSIGAIAKEKKNEGQGYKFRGIDDVLNAVNPALIEFGITPSLKVLESAERIQITEDPMKFEDPREAFKAKAKLRWVTFASIRLQVTLFAPDGTSVSFEGVGSACDHNGDKAMNKAHSCAYKYALTLGLCIPIEKDDLDDSDRDQRVPERTQADMPTEETGNGNGRSGNGRHPSRNAGRESAYRRAEQAILQAATTDRVAEIKAKLRKPEYHLTDEEASELEGLCESRFGQLYAAA